MPDYRVIIAGSRSFNDYPLLREHCLSVLQEKMKTHRVIIVSGHARGADSLGERFANELGLPFEAFWDGESRGTRHMINFARKRGLDISVFNTSQTRSQTIIDIPFKENNGNLQNQDSKRPGSHFHR